LLAAVVAGAAGCSSSSDGAPVTPTPNGGDGGGGGDSGGAPDTTAAAQSDFWNAMWAGDLSAGATASTELKAVVAKTPADFYSTLLVGMQSLWQIAESERNPQTAGMVAQTNAPVAAQYLQTAHQLNPSDVFTMSLLGQFLFESGAQSNNSQQVTQGEALMNQAYQADNKLGMFVPVLVGMNLPNTDPFVQSAEAGAWNYYSTCGGKTIDGTNPDFSAFLAKANSGQSGLGFCGPVAVAPHWLEGALLWFGDSLVKVGNVNAASAAYRASASVSTSSEWPHHDLLEAALSRDLNARAALYQGPPSMWPTPSAAPYGCGGCHNKTAPM